MSRPVNAIVSLALLLLLAACGPPSMIGSVVGGQCKFLESPEYAVKGKTNYDQRWVDRTEEAIVTGCGQPRPKKRPASLDATYAVAGKTVPIPRPAPRHDEAVQSPDVATPTAPPKKKRLRDRLRDLIAH